MYYGILRLDSKWYRFGFPNCNCWKWIQLMFWKSVMFFHKYMYRYELSCFFLVTFYTLQLICKISILNKHTLRYRTLHEMIIFPTFWIFISCNSFPFSHAYFETYYHMTIVCLMVFLFLFFYICCCVFCFHDIKIEFHTNNTHNLW